MKNLYFLLLSVALLSAAIGHTQGDDNCVYTLYVKTGTAINAGTDSNISLTLGDTYGNSVFVRNLLSWGIMDAGHDYYEIGNLDVFSARGPCIETPVCHLRLASDGAGEHHGWYCEYVEVTTTAPHKACTQTIFYVDRWLASDRPPYELTADVDGCSELGEPVKQGIKKKLVVGQPKDFIKTVV